MASSWTTGDSSRGEMHPAGRAAGVSGTGLSRPTMATSALTTTGRLALDNASWTVAATPSRHDAAYSQPMAPRDLPTPVYRLSVHRDFSRSFAHALYLLRTNQPDWAALYHLHGSATSDAPVRQYFPPLSSLREHPTPEIWTLVDDIRRSEYWKDPKSRARVLQELERSIPGCPPCQPRHAQDWSGQDPSFDHPFPSATGAGLDPWIHGPDHGSSPLPEQSGRTARPIDVSDVPLNTPPGHHGKGKSGNAPENFCFACPSKGCKVRFKRKRHLHNHIDKKHPDFERVHPEYEAVPEPIPAPTVQPGNTIRPSVSFAGNRSRRSATSSTRSPAVSPLGRRPHPSQLDRGAGRLTHSRSREPDGPYSPSPGVGSPFSQLSMDFTSQPNGDVYDRSADPTGPYPYGFCSSRY